MAFTASSVGRVVARALFVLAALFLAMGPSLDTAAHAAARSEQIDHPVSQVLAAFDVIEDVTDYIPGDPPKTQGQQLLLAVAWPDPAQPLIEVPGQRNRDWTRQISAPLVSAFSDNQDDPPRG